MSEHPTLGGHESPEGIGPVDAHRETLHADEATSSPDAAAAVASPAASPAPMPARESTSFDAWIGHTIDDRYRVEALLGEGGMGAVLLAEHLKLQKKVAIKVILPQFAGVGELAERFAREAMASAQLDHPHIASALDYGVLGADAPGRPEGSNAAGGGAYLVMQLVRGRSLRDAMDEHVGDWAFACEVGAQIADALSAAHAARIVHRDLKPENVMLESREGAANTIHVRVLDFGVARVVGDDTTEGGGARKLTRVGTILGTPGYMAPEQALGESVDERADLYALGILLWESVVGRELFSGADVPAILTAQLTQAIVPIRTYAQDVPPELDALVTRLLAPQREERPARAADVRDTLRKLALARQLERVSATGAFALEGAARSAGSIATSAAWQGAGASKRDRHGDGAAPNAAWPLLTGPSRSLVLGLAAAASLLLVIVGIALGATLSAGPSLPGPALTTAPELTGTVLTGVEPAGTPQGTPGSTSPVTEPSTTLPLGLPPPITVGAQMTPELARDLGILIESDSRETRRTAAQSLLAQPRASLPPLLDALARLEMAEGCSAKRSALRTVRELRDPLALPAVERLGRLPRRGCGLFGRQDCWSCLRGELRRTLQSLRGETVAAETDTEAEPDDGAP